MKQKMIIVGLVMAVLLYFTFPKPETVSYDYQDAVQIEPFEVVVTGAVNLPGTYYFFRDVSMSEVIERAGGLRDEADVSLIAFSNRITYDTNIDIASIDEEVTETVIKLNINEASFADLLDVPYMSESRAAYIIMYREEHGDFQSLDDLLDVKYIGAATLENIKPYLTLS